MHGLDISSLFAWH